MARTMKAAVVREFKKPLSIDEVPVPEVGQGQILVKIEASGVCHTDLHAADGDWPVKPKPPFIPGHEGVGTVAAVGAGVTAVKEGDRLGVPWLHTACGHCRHCLAGWETLCDAQKNTGYSVNGGFAEYVLADPNYVGHLPDGLDWDMAAPILCAGVTVYKGLKETDTKPGDTVVISGIGGLGHIAVQYARAMGLDVIAVDISDEKLALARDMGASAAINAKTTDPVAEVKALCGGARSRSNEGVATTDEARAAGGWRREAGMTSSVIALAADHAGYAMKNSMKAVLEEHGFPLVDLGPETADPVDYPDMAAKLAAALTHGRAQQGLLVCGTGIGIAIAANRYPWIRAAVCHDVTAARLAREHNDANVLALGARLIGPEVARDCLLTFLKTRFAGGRHAGRVAKMSAPVSQRAPCILVGVEAGPAATARQASGSTPKRWRQSQ